MEWTEVIDVDRPLAAVQRAVADENELMQWSAWPEATGYSCVVDGDGTTPGSSIVFTDKRGREQGRQRLSAVSAERVEYRLSNRGPGGREMKPEVDFRLLPIDPQRTRVYLDFRANAPLPPGVRQLAELVLARRVRMLHVKDLVLLKAHVERSTATP